MFKQLSFLAVFLVTFSSTVFSADLKIGVFNGRLVLSKIPQSELIDSKLQAQFKDRIDELNGEQKAGIKKQKDYARDAMTLTDSQKIKIQRELEQLGTDLKIKEKNLQEDFQRANQVEINKIRLKVLKAVNKLAADEKFDLILRIESVAFRSETIDVSNKIITILSNPAG